MSLYSGRLAVDAPLPMTKYYSLNHLDAPSATTMNSEYIVRHILFVPFHYTVRKSLSASYAHNLNSKEVCIKRRCRLVLRESIKAAVSNIDSKLVKESVKAGLNRALLDNKKHSIRGALNATNLSYNERF